MHIFNDLFAGLNPHLKWFFLNVHMPKKQFVVVVTSQSRTWHGFVLRYSKHTVFPWLHQNIQFSDQHSPNDFLQDAGAEGEFSSHLGWEGALGSGQDRQRQDVGAPRNHDVLDSVVSCEKTFIQIFPSSCDVTSMDFPEFSTIQWYLDRLEAEFPSASFGEDRNTGGNVLQKKDEMTQWRYLVRFCFLETLRPCPVSECKEWSQEVLNENAGC